MAPDQVEPPAQDAILPVWLLLALLALDVWHINRPPGMREPAEPWMFPLYCGPYLATAITTAWARTRPFGLGIALGSSFVVSLIGVPLSPLLLLGRMFDRVPTSEIMGQIGVVALHTALAAVSWHLYRRTVTNSPQGNQGAAGIITGALAVIAALVYALNQPS
jgi:hypothetical protein